MGEREAFLKAIGAAPLSHLCRSVFADWLDERGEVEEADRQRNWVAAFERLRDGFYVPFRREVAEYRGDDDAAVAVEAADVAGVLDQLARWKDGLLADGGFSLGPAEGLMCRLWEPAERRRFCGDLAVLFGEWITDEVQQAAWFRCAC